jgi:hypothetical protein
MLTRMNASSKSRSRKLYAIAMVLIIVAGLIWRSHLLPLSSFSKYGGDALWAMLVFFGFGFVFVRASTLRVTLMAFCFSCAVEFRNCTMRRGLIRCAALASVRWFWVRASTGRT